MKLSFSIALRFLKSSKGQTVLIALGIAVGVSVQVFIGLLIQGLQQSLIERTVGNSSQITVTSKRDDKRIENQEEKVRAIEALDSNIINVSVAADVSAFLKLEEKTEPILIRGFDLNRADAIYNFKAGLTEGKLPYQKDTVIAGKELKEKLSLVKGQKLTVITADGRKTEVRVAGFYDLKVAAINEIWIITNFETSQRIADIGNDVTSIEMQTRQIFEADKLADKISVKLSEISINTEDSKASSDVDTSGGTGKFDVTSWIDKNGQLLSGLNGQSISSLIIQIFVMVSVVLAIACVLAISVIQKSRQIGILKAMGLKNREASLVFLFEGLILGLAGAVSGILLGLGLIYMFTEFAVNPDGTPVVEVAINYSFILNSGLIAVVSAAAASLIPARKSSKLSPIEVIKNG